MKLSFCFNPDPKRSPARLAKKLIAQYGNHTVADADVIVAVGGDGTVLHALPDAHGKPVYGIVPPTSRSFGYTMNRFREDEDLIDSIKTTIDSGGLYKLHPLLIDVTYRDGKHQKIQAFGDIVLNHDNGQSAYLDVTATFNKQASMLRIEGDGLAIATALSSTAASYSNGGAVLSIDQPLTVLTVTSASTPRGFRPIIGNLDTKYEIDCIDGEKRALRIDYDGKTVRPDPGNPFEKIIVRLGHKPAGQLAIKSGGAGHPFYFFQRHR